MASPQVENGYLKIANEVWERLASSGITGSEFPVVMTIIRQSWGWKKKEADISLAQFKEFTSLPERTIAHALKSLMSRNMIHQKHGGGRGKHSKYAFNKDWETWKREGSKSNILSKETLQPIAENKNSAIENSVSDCRVVLQPIAEFNADFCRVSSQKSLIPEENEAPKAIIKERKASKEPSAPPPRDKAFDFFAEIFEKKTGTPYLKCKGDFVQLSALRKAFGIGARDTPQDWEVACRNYLDSPMGSYSIAHMVTGNRYAVLRKSRIDRFGKPEQHETGGQLGFNKVSGEPGSTSEQRTSRGERLYIPKQ